MREITAKRLLTTNKDPGFWFDVRYTMNLYRGCTFGCIYCDSRSECYHVDDFDTVAFKAIAWNYLTLRQITEPAISIPGLALPCVPDRESFSSEGWTSILPA